MKTVEYIMRNSFLLLIIVLFAFAENSLSDQTSSNNDADYVKLQPLVCNNNEGGCIKGIYMPGYQTKSFEAFLGIPFAEPPINKLRFANPKPVDAWKTTIIADTAKEMCLQKNYYAVGQPINGSEDCLYLNIYRPKNSYRIRKPFPVIVYIYGGAFVFGSAGPSYVGPQYFMDTKQVILVTMGYRVGAFGFLSTGDKFMPGNFGLKDQALALKWVHQNIKYFNGNPRLVTLFGQSAGGSSVNYQMLSNLSKGLFHRAAILSGVSLAPIARVEAHPLEVARKQAKYVGISNYKTLSTEQLTKELRKVDPLDLLKSGDSFKRFFFYPLDTFGSVIEDAHDPNSFLTNDPRVLMANGEFNYVPLLFSFVDNEGLPTVGSLLTNKTLLSEFNKNLLKSLPYILLLNNETEKVRTKRLNDIIKYYLGGRITVDEENEDGLINAISDCILVSFYDTIKWYTKHLPPRTPVNLFKISFKGRYSLSQRYITKKDYGILHGDDLFYYFTRPVHFPPPEINSPETKASLVLVQSMVKFAKTGVPIKWVPIDDCKYDRLNPKKFCDYQQILKEDDVVRIKLDNSFNYKMLSIWQ